MTDAPRPRSPAEAPLAGIRVLDFSRVVAGPYCTMLLGDAGADVVKVEEPGVGDDTRAWGPPFAGGESTYFLGVNRNKRSIAVDLRAPEGAELARRLAAEADVIVESFRPGTMDRLGLGYERLRENHPGLVYCAISAFGSDGPYRDRAGYDVMVSALGGLMGVTGTPGGPPVKIGVALLDVCTGLNAQSGILQALLHRERTGLGQRVETSLLSTDLAVLINAASSWLIAGEILRPQGTAHPSIVPYQAFACADGFVLIGAGNDRLFARLAESLGRPELASDPRFATNADRVANRKALVPLIGQITRTRSVAHWVDALAAADVAVAPINDIAEVFEDPQVQASGQVVTVEHPTAGDIPMVGPAVSMGATPNAVRLPPPTLGRHTDEVLAGIGVTPAELSDLRTRGVVA